MKYKVLSSIIATTITLSSGLVHAQEAEPRINRIQLNEQVREAVQASTHEEASIRNTERYQDRISQNQQTGTGDQKMEQHRYQYQQRKVSNQSSHYGQGYESRSRLMGASSRGGSGRQGSGRR